MGQDYGRRLRANLVYLHFQQAARDVDRVLEFRLRGAISLPHVDDDRIVVFIVNFPCGRHVHAFDMLLGFLDQISGILEHDSYHSC